MRATLGTILLAVFALPAGSAAQANQPIIVIDGVPLERAGVDAKNPVSDAFRFVEQRQAKNITEAAELMPADKYGYKPTPAQMSFGDVVAHLIADGNDYLCSAASGQKSPDRPKFAGTDPKDKLVAGLKDSFQFCATALAAMQDAQLGDSIKFFGGRMATRGLATLITVADWADHYSQMANYLRLNGLLPPTAKRAAQ
jgi:DinB family protein